ncbi:MAG: TolC family protein [Sphingomonas sp.]|uniref:efflux transporter outer membrane subunit n=1 Tax=Sphingomonas sp. TaxID=28214 RepID=UPI001B13CA7A|nr:TolC family protein [Sphingomonas sp.]MBO9622953.1 TolC family protein [Sphingomonas sp.]
MDETTKVRKGQRGRLVLAVVTCSTLSACVSAPPVRTADTALPVSYTPTSGALPAVALDRWWDLYRDPQLTQLVDQALSRGFDTREAFARLEEARAIRSGALSQFGLQGSLSANAQVQRTEQITGGASVDVPGVDLGSLGGSSRTSTSAGVTLPVSWELDLFGRRGVTERTANADLAAARFNYEGVRAATAAEVARALFQARGLATQLEDARATATIQRRLFDLLSRRADRGLAARSEADRVGADVAQAEAQATDLTAALDASRRALLLLVGSGTRPIGALAISPAVASPPQVPAAVPGDLLQRRPDVREAEARLRSATGNVRLAELDFFPRITLQPSLGLNYASGALGGLSAVAGLGAGLTAPIFDGARLRAQLGVSGARAEQAVLAYERTVQGAYSEADQALIRLVADRDRIARLERGVAAAQRAYDAALKRFDLGFSDLQEVLDAERVARAARTARTTARVDALQRSVQAFQALGGGWDTRLPGSDIRGMR